MELVIALFLGAFLIAIGAMSYIRISRDYKGGRRK